MSFTHDRIICSLLCDCLSPPLVSSFLVGVYKQYTQLRCIAIAWNFTGIIIIIIIIRNLCRKAATEALRRLQNMIYGTCLPGYWTFQQIYIRYLTYWWKFRHIHIMRMVLTGFFSLLYFNIVWLCPDVYPFSLHLFLVHSVHRMSTFSHGFSCIWNVYL